MVVLMKGNVTLKDEVQRLTQIYLCFTKRKENLDTLLGEKKFVNDKIGLGFENSSSEKEQKEKSFSEKVHVNVTIECIEEALKNILQIGNSSRHN